MLQLLMKSIQFVNNFGPVLACENIKIKEDEIKKETFEFDFSKTESGVIEVKNQPKFLKIGSIEFPN